MSSKNIIEAKNLIFTYSDAPDALSGKVTAAVNDISVDIERGSFTAIIGHNGSGKSTLAKLLSGIFVPNSGSVQVYRSDCDMPLDCNNEEHNFDIRKTVGMVFQNPDNQLVATIVEDDVAFAPENLGVEPSEIRKRVDSALETVGLIEYSGHDTHKLSGGQKQRVAIAGILAMNPECIIFDESTAMLDPQGRRDIMDTILSLRKKGVTVVLITHYMNEAAMADKVVVVHDGRVAFEGTPKQVFANKKILSECSLEPPQCSMLIDKLSRFIDCDAPCAINVKEAVEVIEKALAKHGIMPGGEDKNA
ncbi:MAG: energy-coupling factor transporter ATPase [Clostridia bacterium]|nr:energy-coupling factor transporter ATPase [Clostridia bacterium]